MPTFHTSVVLYKHFEKAGGSWDIQAKTLMYNGKMFCQILNKHGQFVVEYTPLNTSLMETLDLTLAHMPSLCTTDLMDLMDLKDYRTGQHTFATVHPTALTTNPPTA